MKKRPLLERLRAKKRLASQVVGVTWYTEAEWARVKATATDPERFEATFQDWKAMADEALLELMRAGITVEKVLVNAEELQAWCQLKHKPNSASARAEFVSGNIG